MLLFSLLTVFTGCNGDGGAPILEGVAFSQIDFTWPESEVFNSNIGQVDVDVETIRSAFGIEEGFINISTELGWVVKNLPVFSDFSYPRISTRFKLSTSSGTDITSLDAIVLFSPEPLFELPSGEPQTFPVGDKALNAQGKGIPIADFTPSPPIPEALLFIPGGFTFECEQVGHQNIEAADNQCGPAATANSLKWLEDTFGINIPHPHRIGLGNDGSLVGSLDVTMDRTFRNRADGDPISDEQFLEGKLEYLADNGLGGEITVKHQDDGPVPGGGNFTRHGLTSQGNGAPTPEFLIEEVCAGEDVEVGYTYPQGGGHWVNVVAAGFLLGVPYVFHVSDREQSDDTRGTDTVDFSFLLDTDGDNLPNLVNEAGVPEVDIVVSESPTRPVI